MNSYIGKVFSNFRDFYNEINTATLTGAIDVVVVEQADGSYHCSPFHVRFGKLGVLRSREKVVDIEINGEPLDIQMKLGESGEAFFVEEVPSGELGDDEFIPPHLATSPIPSETFLSRYHDEQRVSITELDDEWLHKEQRPGFDLENILTKDLEEMSRVNWPQVPGVASHLDMSVATQEISLLVTNTVKDSDVEDPVGTPKTFRAETMEGKVSEKVRRISIVTGEFRPIVMEPQDVCKVQELAVEELPVVLPPPKDADRPNQEMEVGVEPLPAVEDGNQKIGKRKRRKKSLMKKKVAMKKNVPIGQEPIDTLDGGVGAGELKEVCTTQLPVSVENGDIAAENIFEIEDLGDSFDQSDSVQQEPCNHLPDDVVNCDTCLHKTALLPISRGKLSTPLSISLPPLSSLAAKDNGSAAEVVSCMKHASTENNFHFFSDTEVTPGSSPLDSRPNSPVQSDTEAERQRHTESSGVGGEKDEVTQSWRWGELPSPPPKLPGTSRQTSTNALIKDDASIDQHASQTQDAAAAEAAHRSIISGMFSFMKKTKRLRHNPDGEGIYLADINADELDPEVAALYFPASYRQMHPQQADGPLSHDEDAESGKGTSLPQSPVPQSPLPNLLGTHAGSANEANPCHPMFNGMCMSLCGGLNKPGGVDEEAFNQKQVTFEAFYSNPGMLEDPDLVIKYEGNYYDYKTALPMIMSMTIFKRPLTQHSMDLLQDENKVEEGVINEGVTVEEGADKKEEAADGVDKGAVEIVAAQTGEGAADQGSKLALQTNMPPHSGAVPEATSGVEPGRGYTSWFSWRKPVEQPKKHPGGPGEYERSLGDGEVEQIVGGMKDTGVLIPNRMGLATHPSFQGTPKSEAIPVPTDNKEDGYNGSNSSEDSDVGVAQKAPKLPYERRIYYEHSDKFRKTLRLSSEQIASLNLQEGANEVVFSVTTAYQGTTRCKCHIYKWRYDDRIVISDIDGTITKSDVLGHILPIVGKDWAQSGVAQLFTKIKNNGYKLLYLSARAIGQARVTREYLRSIKQGDLSLPDGPLLLNPTSLISAFHREVIEKKPEEFKISCLRDIHALFPADSKPFYAGYGNKVNDVWAYRAVGIPIFRIFTINHRGELKHELTQTFQSSYSNMSFIVDQMFPPSPAVDASEDYSSFVYWREPIADITVDPQILALKASKVPNNKKSPSKSPP